MDKQTLIDAGFILLNKEWTLLIRNNPHEHGESVYIVYSDYNIDSDFYAQIVSYTRGNSNESMITAIDVKLENINDIKNIIQVYR